MQQVSCQSDNGWWGFWKKVGKILLITGGTAAVGVGLAYFGLGAAAYFIGAEAIAVEKSAEILAGGAVALGAIGFKKATDMYFPDSLGGFVQTAGRYSKYASA